MSVATITLIAAIASTVIGVGTFFHYFLMVFRWPRATGTVIGNVAQRRSTDGNEYVNGTAVNQYMITDSNFYARR